MISLQGMRDHKKLKWPVAILFGLIIVSFVFFYGWQSSSGAGTYQPLAKYRKESLNPLDQWNYIRVPELQAATKRVIAQKYQMLRMMIPPEALQQIDERIFSGMASMPEARREAANFELVRRESGEWGVSVTHDQFVEYLMQQPGLNNDILTQVARQRGYATAWDFVDAESRNMESDRMKSIIGRLANASLFELWQEYLIAEEQLTLEIASFPSESFTEDVVVTQQDLEDYLADHRDEFTVPPNRRYSFVKLDRAAIREQLADTLTSEQLQVHYEQNQNQYQRRASLKVREIYIPAGANADTPTTQAEAVLTEVLPRLRTDDAWTTIARELEAGDESLTVYARETEIDPLAPSISPDYLARVQGLTGDAITTPIIEPHRVSVVRVLERVEAGISPFEEVYDRVRASYLGSRITEQMEETAVRWRENIGDFATVAEFAASVGLEDRLTTTVQPNVYFIPEVGDLRQVRDYIYNMREGDPLDVVRVPDGVVVIEIRETNEAYDPPLAEVRDEVEEAVRLAGAGDRARIEARQNFDIVEGGAPFDEALADAPTPPRVVGTFKRTENVPTLDAPLIDFRRNSLELRVGQIGMNAYGFDPDNPMGYAIWKVVSVEQPTREQFKEDRANFEMAYIQRQRLALIEEWLADLRREADFTVIAAE